LIKRSNSHSRRPALDARDSRGRQFPALAVYRTYGKGVYGHTGTFIDTDVMVEFETRAQYVIRAMVDMSVANPHALSRLASVPVFQNSQ